jgi:large subunit ribosomal protein L21
MKYAIVESGGKQYKAVEGVAIEVDRLPDAVGTELKFESVLLMVDDENVTVGTPFVSGFQVKATVLEHFRGKKVITFKYRPKKRIRVKGGHRQHYTRLMIDQVGKPGEARKVVKAEAAPKVESKRQKPSAAAKKATAKKAETKKVETKKVEKKTEPKKAVTKKAETKKVAPKKADTKKAETKKAEPKKSEKAPAKKSTSKDTGSKAKPTKSTSTKAKSTATKKSTEKKSSKPSSKTTK